MPMTDRISLLTRQCFSGEMIGMPPPTAASNMMSTPVAAAASMTSWPADAMSALFAVTTDLPARRAESTTSFAAPVPPISSITMSTAGSAISSASSVVHASAGRPSSAKRSVPRSAKRTRRMSTPARREKSSPWRRMISTTPEPTVPRPMRPTPMVPILQPSLRGAPTRCGATGINAGMRRGGRRTPFEYSVPSRAHAYAGVLVRLSCQLRCARLATTRPAQGAAMDRLTHRTRPASTWAVPLGVALGVVLTAGGAFLEAAFAGRRAVPFAQVARVPVRGATQPSNLASVAAAISEPTPTPSATATTEPFDAKRAFAQLQKIVSFGPRQSGSAAEDKSAEYVRGQFEALGYTTTVEEVPLPDGKTTHNVVALKPGGGAGLIVVGGHVDSHLPSPGANDDASGVGV